MCRRCERKNRTCKKKKSCSTKFTPLCQKSFNSGTYRIKTPGIYKFVGNVTFNAPVEEESKRPDTPINGYWFAGLTVECDNVVIDGQGYTFSVSPSYIQNNLVGTFADVLLGNNQFSGVVFGGAGSQFPDTTSYVAANNVSVKNLNIVGKSSHFGIMGNNNDNINIDNCNISDCQVSNVYMQSVQGFVLTNSNLSGSTTPVTIIQDQTQLDLMEQQYPKLIAAGVPGAAAQFAALQAYVAANPARFDPVPMAFPSSALYGVFLVPGPTALFPQPMNAETSAISASFAGGFRNGEYNENVTITNCNFSNFITSFNEIVAIGTNASDPPSPYFPLTGWPLIFFGLFGCIQWKDAFDTLNNFNPNAFLQSIVFIMNYVYPSLGGLQPLLPSNSLAIFDSILNSNAAEFYSNAAPLVSIQSDGTTAKGVFALRSVSVKNALFDHLTFNNVSAIGPAPIVPTTLPGYANVTQPQPVTESGGNDAWHVGLEVVSNIVASNITMTNITSLHGNTFAYENSNENSNSIITNSSSTNQSAPNTIVTPTMGAGESFGFTVENNTGVIVLQDLTTHNLTAGGAVVPFAAPSAVFPQIIVTNCVST